MTSTFKEPSVFGTTMLPCKAIGTNPNFHTCTSSSTFATPKPILSAKVAKIAQTFRGGYLYLHTESQNVNSLNYERPLIVSMKAVQFLIDTNTRSEVSLYMQKMILSTYDGLIYNGDAQSFNYYKQTFYTINSMSLESEETMFWSCFLLSSTKLLTVERYYSTIIEVAGIIGGISKFLIFIGFIVTAKFNGNVLIWRLVKESFAFNFYEGKSNKTNTLPYFEVNVDTKGTNYCVIGKYNCFYRYQDREQR